MTGTVNIGTNGNGASAGTAGNWDTTLTNWDQGNALAHVAWVNANLDTAAFGGTAGTVTLTAPVTVGGLRFDVTGYTIAAGVQGLTFGAGNDTILFNGFAAASITGTVTGAGNVSLRTSSPNVASTLTLGGTSAGGWSGTTTIGASTTLSLTGSNQGLLNTTGITLDGGNITLTNATAGEATLDRVSSNAITSNGGTFTYANTAASGRVYAETIGSVGLVSGQTNFTLATSQASGGGNVQTLTLSGLTRTGNTSAIAFASAGSLNNSTNIIVVNGAGGATPAGQIVGPWATTGNTAGQFDYAVYNASNQVLGAGIAASVQTGWTADRKSVV